MWYFISFYCFLVGGFFGKVVYLVDGFGLGIFFKGFRVLVLFLDRFVRVLGVLGCGEGVGMEERGNGDV